MGKKAPSCDPLNDPVGVMCFFIQLKMFKVINHLTTLEPPLIMAVWVLTVLGSLLSRLCSPICEAFSNGIQHIPLWFNESSDHTIWITVKRAVSRKKMPHLPDCTISVLINKIVSVGILILAINLPAKWLRHNNWITLLLLCTKAPLVLCCDWFDRGSRQVKGDPVDLVMDDYDITLCWRIPGA